MRKRRLLFLVLLTGLGALLLLPVLHCVFPFPAAMLADYPAGAVFCDRNGEPLRVQLGLRDLDCRPIYQPRRSDWIVRAIVAVEDHRFWSHRGVDPRAVLRALVQDIAGMRKVSGASTLSMQVIRLARPRPRTGWSKAVEMGRALQMERILTKDEILSQYLNRAPFGGNLVGIEAASAYYFAKKPADLSLAEAALLAGLPQSPSRLRPDRYPESARTRQAMVLARMEACGLISAAERAVAFAQPIALHVQPRPFRAPHFCDLVEARWTGLPNHPAAAKVRTTLDPRLQRIAEDALACRSAALADRHIHGGAIVILDVATGALRALVGSPDFFDGRAQGQVNAALAPRAPGSTLKPFAYALAFDRGLCTPNTVLADVPRSFGDYRPGNFDEEFRGLIPAREALILSLNLPALEVEQRIGQPVLYHALQQLGLETVNCPAGTYGMGLVLGNAEARLLDLANAYACLARGGDWKPIRLFEDERSGGARQVFSSAACWLVADALSGSERAFAATGHDADVRLPHLAWKTGTSAGFHDAWTLAFNPEYVVGVWTGNPDGSPSDGLVGRDAAAPIAWSIFRQLYPDNDSPWFEPPADLTRRNVCAVSGEPPGPYCPHTVEDWCIRGVSSCRACAVHPRPPDADGRIAEIWPPEVEQFIAQQRTEEPKVGGDAAGLRITSPAAGAVFRWLDDSTRVPQQLPLTAAGTGVGPIHWFDHAQYLGKTWPGQPLFVPLTRGGHDYVCSDAAGHCDRVGIRVE